MGSPLKLTEHFRSDLLSHVRGFLAANSDNAPLVRMLVRMIDLPARFRLIVDANIAISCTLRLARAPDMRTSLMELVDADMAVAYAPRSLEQEILENLPEVCKSSDIPLENLLEAWRKTSTYLRFLPSSEIEGLETEFPRLRDPDDRPYLAAGELIGADAILSKDPHIIDASKRPVASIDFLIDLRTFARNRAVTASVKLLLGGTLYAGGLSVAGLFKMLVKLLEVLRGVPGWALALLGTGLGVAAFYFFFTDGGRDAFRRAWEELRDLVARSLSALEDPLHEVAVGYGDADEEAKAALARVSDRLHTNKKRTLAQVARGVLAASRRPLTTREVLRQSLADGYVSRGRTSASYVARVLRGSVRAQRLRDGRWKLTAVPGNVTT